LGQPVRPEDDEYIGYMLSDVARLMRTVFDRRMRDLGLTRGQWLVLTRLYRRPGASQTELADMLEVDRASAGRMIDRMEKGGWVERRADVDDRRINRLHLTDEARKVHADMWAVAEATVDDALSPLSAAERAQYTELTAKVKGQLRDEYRIKQVTKVTANTLEELVKKLDDVNADAALKEIKAYNAAVSTDIPFNPNVKDGRCTTGLAVNKSNWANTIDTPPFEAYAVTCGITFSFGGLRINTGAQVIDTDGQPMRGLYAAGELVGGIFWFNYPGGSGLTNGAVFGRIAGASAAKKAA